SMSNSSRRVMWKLNEEEETFESMVNYRRAPVRGTCVSKQPSSNQASDTAESDLPARKRNASENWLMLLRELRQKRAIILERDQNKKASIIHDPSWKNNLSSATSLPDVTEPTVRERADSYWQQLFTRIYTQCSDNTEGAGTGIEHEEPTDIALTVKPSLALRYKPSHESLKNKQSRDLGIERFCSASKVAPKLVTDLQVESFCLPPRQTCVVHEIAPKFAQRLRMSIGNDTDLCCSAGLEVPKNSPELDLEGLDPTQQQQARLRSELISVHVSAPTTSSFVESAQKLSLPIGRRNSTRKVANGTKRGSGSNVPAPGCNKCSSSSSGSTGIHLPTFRQRQQELHRYRVLIERRRLDLLELKIAREREEALHSELLFHKDLQIKDNMIKAYEDNDCSNA
ncbi:hypothetical protein KR018_003775, partial [Drosophila ironensis]